MMLDFGAYLSRIGLDPAGEPTWQAVHRAHATTIPFENLDSHRGIPVSLEQADLERKLAALACEIGDCLAHPGFPFGSKLRLDRVLELRPKAAQVRLE